MVINKKINEFFKGFFEIIIIGIIVLVLIWLPLFILGETDTISDDIASIFFFGFFGFPLIIFIIGLSISIYHFIKKRNSFALGILLPSLAIEILAILFWIALSIGGEM